MAKAGHRSASASDVPVPRSSANGWPRMPMESPGTLRRYDSTRPFIAKTGSLIPCHRAAPQDGNEHKWLGEQLLFEEQPDAVARGPFVRCRTDQAGLTA